MKSSTIFSFASGDSVCSKRLFSGSGLTVPSRRTWPTSNISEISLFLHNNIVYFLFYNYLLNNVVSI